MGYSKSIALGSLGSLVISEAAGQVQVQLSLSDQAGGGSIGGFAKGTVSVAISLDSKELIDAGLSLAETKFPAASAEIAALKAIVDAAVASI